MFRVKRNSDNAIGWAQRVIFPDNIISLFLLRHSSFNGSFGDYLIVFDDADPDNAIVSQASFWSDYSTVSVGT